MNDYQTIAAAILAAAAGLGAALKWAVSRVCKSIDDSAAVQLKFVESATRLELLLTQAHAAAMASAATVQEVAEEFSGVHESAGPLELDDEPPRRTTPAGGYAYHPGKKART